MPWYKRKSVIAAIGGFLTSGVALVAYLLTWGPELTALVEGLLGAGLAVWGVGVTPDKPASATSGRGFAALRLLALIVAAAVLSVVAGALLPGCAHTTCPAGDHVVSTYQAGPPSKLAARCSSDPAEIERVSATGPGKGRFDVLCPAGFVPGPGTSRASQCDGKPCTRSELTCVEAQQ